MRPILERAAATGLTMARIITFNSRDPRARAYPGRQWEWLFLADAATFETPTHLDVDARVTYTYGALWTSPAMVQKIVGGGSQYLAAYKDKQGNWLDVAKNYSLRIEPNVPVKDFWSVMVYDAVTRSMIDTEQGKAGLDSYGTLAKNSDGSLDLYFGPNKPAQASNWIKTRPDRGFFLYFRAYGPLQPFFDQTWALNDVQLRQ
jgi:hypothetical protein